MSAPPALAAAGPAAAAGDAAELRPPDLSPYRAGNTGVEYVTSFDSGRPGPHVMIAAVVHGNEICGAIALDELLRGAIRPAAGRLTLAFANPAAYARFDPRQPTRSRCVDEDFNRLWDATVLDGPRRSCELDRARRLRPIVDRVDFLLDIHSMQQGSTPLLLAGPLAKGRRLARRLGAPAVVVCDAGHAAGRRLRDYAGFADPASPRAALLVECGAHGERRSAAVAIETALRFLACLRVIEPAVAAAHLPPAPPAAQRIVEVSHAVTIATEAFRFAADYRGLEVVARAGSVIARDGDRPVTTPYDDCVLIMPSRRLVPGQTAVRLGRFVE